jgi:hypothetical protein
VLSEAAEVRLVVADGPFGGRGPYMREIKKRTVQAAVCAALLAGWVGAAAADDITTTISGYGTLGGSFTSNNQYVYHHDGNEFTGANEQFDVALDSRLGLQAIVDFGSGLSVTAQELIKQRGSDEFSLGTEWLYVQYAPDSHWKLRLGRVALATFLLSDVRNVGYAQPWLRQPNEVYGAESFQSLNRGQALYHVNLGPVGLGLEGAFGNSTEQYFIDGVTSNVNAKNAYNVAVSFGSGCRAGESCLVTNYLYGSGKAAQGIWRTPLR